MKILVLIYNGHFAMAVGSHWISSPMRAAWTFCTLSTILYALTGFAVLSVVAEGVMTLLPLSERMVQLAIILAIVLFSDLRNKNSWFGACPIVLTDQEQNRAKRLALAFSAGSYVVFLTVNIILFAKF